MILGILSALLALSPAPDSLEVRGRVPPNPDVIISVPALRTGTVAAKGGAFRLRLPPAKGCQELLVRYSSVRTVVRFLVPASGGPVDLGDVKLPKREPSEFRIGAEPLVSDTVGTCIPVGGPWPERWLGAQAAVRGIVTRNGRPLRQASINVNCGPYITSEPARTDDSGTYSLTVGAWFPHDLDLVDGRAACLLYIGWGFDAPVPLELQFSPVGKPVSAAKVDVALPGPNFTLGDTVAQSGDYNTPMPRFRDAVAFRAGTMSGSDLVRIAIVNRPAEPAVYRRGVCRLPAGGGPVSANSCDLRLELPDSLAASQLLPLGVLVSTGRVQPSGGKVLLNLPDEYAPRVGPTQQLHAYYRLPRRFVADPDVYLPLVVNFMPETQLFYVDLVGAHFDDARSARHEFEALILLRFGPPDPVVR